MIKKKPNYKNVFIFYFIINAFVFADLEEEDARLEEIRKKIKEGAQKELLIEMKLNFQNFHGNFIVFYDYLGEPIYLKYRENKWDRKNDNKTAYLQKGITYIVKATVKGTIQKAPEKDESNLNKIMEKYNKKNIENKKEIREFIPVLLGTFGSAQNFEIENIEF